MMDKRTSTSPLHWLWFVFLFFLGTGAALATQLPAGVKEIRHLEGITEYRLESNGLTVLLAPDESKSSVTVNMTYLVGSRHESYGQTGMAHLLEHMIFKGTPTTRNALAEFSKRGLQSNGSTSVDRTNYYATFSANPETLDWFIRWQADAMVNSLIAREDLDSEMTVVRNEMESGENSPMSMLFQKTHSAAYQWHNYGKSTIGARSDVEGVDIGQLQAFYRKYYQPDNAVLTIAGKFDVGQTLSVIADAFSPIPRPERVLPDQYTREPVQDGERRVVLRRTGGTPLIATVYHVPPATHADYAAIEMASQIIGDTPSGRLYKALVQSGLATGVFGTALDRKDPSTAFFGAELTPDTDPDKALSVMTQAIENLRSEPLTEQELNRARSQWLNGWNQVYSDMGRVGIRLSESIALGDWRMFFKQRDMIRDVTLEQVQQAAQRYFLEANRTEGIYLPTDKPLRAPVIEQVDLNALLEGYEGDPSKTHSVAFDSSPANIEASTQRKILNLPSGPIQLALLPKPSRGDRVEAALTLRFGSAELLKGKSTIASFTADTLAYGTTKMSRQQIEDRFNELETRYSIGGSGTGVHIRLSSTKENLPEALALALHILKDPAFPQDQITEYVNDAVNNIKSAKTDPRALADNAIDRYGNPWPADDLRYVPTFDEALQRVRQIKREELVDFHKQFYGNGRITMAAVGSFEPQAVEKVLSDELGQWKRAPAYQRVETPYIAIKPTQIVIETPDKANAVFMARLPIQIQDTDPRYPALVMANFLLGQSPSSRLWMKVRETEGLSYSVGSGLSVSDFEPSGDWSASAIFAPENRQRLENAINAVLDATIKDGFSQSELDAGIEALLNLRALSRSRDGSLTTMWMNYLDNNRTFEWAKAFDEKVKALTLEQVNQAVREFIRPEGLARVVAGDFAKTTR